MYCSKCGAQNPDGSVFCASCGSNTAAPAPAPAPSVQVLVQNAKASKGMNFKAVIVVLAVILVLLFSVLIFVSSNKSESVIEPLKKSDVVGKWYCRDGDLWRKVFVFKDNGKMYMCMESGDFFKPEDEDDYGTYCGKWKIIDDNSIQVTYDDVETEGAKTYFSETGKVNIAINEDGTMMNVYAHTLVRTKSTFEKYPDDVE